MTHEFNTIVEEAQKAHHSGLKSVLASVVALDGSSYRRPGVRMLIKDNGSMVGAVSGGCVEKEILLQSASVFKTGTSKIMTYDGRYRLGCKGILYILIELFEPETAFYTSFKKVIRDRKSFEITSYYHKKEEETCSISSKIKIEDTIFSIHKNEDKRAIKNLADYSVFTQKMQACFKLIIIGSEHDAVQLCKFAVLTGWQVTIVANITESKSIEDFPGASEFHAINAEDVRNLPIDNETAIVLMTHNFANDLRYLVALNNANTPYIGILGPTQRREDLLAQFIEYCPDVNDIFLETIHGPAGINIGAETPQEIAISIISEILSIIRNQNIIPLHKKVGNIHT